MPSHLSLVVQKSPPSYKRVPYRVPAVPALLARASDVIRMQVACRFDLDLVSVTGERLSVSPDSWDFFLLHDHTYCNPDIHRPPKYV